MISLAALQLLFNRSLVLTLSERLIDTPNALIRLDPSLFSIRVCLDVN